MKTEPERFPRKLASDVLDVVADLLKTRLQIHEEQQRIKERRKVLDAMWQETHAALESGLKFLHTFGVKLPAEGYAILGLFEDGSEPPL